MTSSRNPSIVITLRLEQKLFPSNKDFVFDTPCRFTLKSIPVTLESSGENRQPPKGRLYIPRHRLFQRYTFSVYNTNFLKRHNLLQHKSIMKASILTSFVTLALSSAHSFANAVPPGMCYHLALMFGSDFVRRVC